MSHYPDDPQCGRSLWQRIRDRWDSLVEWVTVRYTWRDDALSDIQRDSVANRAALVDIRNKIDDLTGKVITMGAREDAAYEKLSGDIQSVKDGWASLVAERDQYKAALESADADKAAAVQAALDADSEFDAAKIEAADAALAELVAPAPPVDNGGGEEVPPVDDVPAGDGEAPLDPNTGNE